VLGRRGDSELAILQQHKYNSFEENASTIFKMYVFLSFLNLLILRGVG